MNVSVSHLQIVKAVSVSIMIDDYEDQFKKKKKVRLKIILQCWQVSPFFWLKFLEVAPKKKKKKYCAAKTLN